MYRLRVDSFLRGDVASEAFRPQHAAMGVYEQRMPGRYMVRIRVGAGRILPAQLRRIAILSKTRGNGVLHVTTRQDIQIHDVALEDTPAIIESLLEEGLSTHGSGGNTVRNVTACPRAGICRNEAFDVSPYALAVGDYFLRRESSFTLPRKFKVAFSGCPNDCALASVADVGFFADVREGRRGFKVYAGGGLGPNACGGVLVADFIPAGECLTFAEAARRVFDKYGDRTNRNRARLRYVLDRLGEEAFVAAVSAEAGQLVREGLRLPELPAEEEPAGGNGHFYFSDNPAVLPEKRPGLYTIAIRLPLGDIPADDLVKLSHRAEAYGEGIVRTSQHQDLLVTGVPADEVPSALAAFKSLEVWSRPQPGPKVIACAGAATCRLGFCRSRDLAAAISDVVVRASGQETSPIRISGCPNSCSAHQLAPIGFEGRVQRVNGRLMPSYTVYAGGRPSAGGAQLGNKLGVVPAKRIPELLRRALNEDATGPERLAGLVAEFALFPEPVPDDWFTDFGAAQPFSMADRSKHGGDTVQ